MTTHDYTVTYARHYYAILGSNDDSTLLNLRVVGEDIAVGDLLTLQGGYQYTVAQIDSIIDDVYVLVVVLEDE